MYAANKHMAKLQLAGTELRYRFAISCSLYDGIIISAVGLRVLFKEFMFAANMRNVRIEVDPSSA